MKTQIAFLTIAGILLLAPASLIIGVDTVTPATNTTTGVKVEQVKTTEVKAVPKPVDVDKKVDVKVDKPSDKKVDVKIDKQSDVKVVSDNQDCE